jgi:hypothetical protein
VRSRICIPSHAAEHLDHADHTENTHGVESAAVLDEMLAASAERAAVFDETLADSPADSVARAGSAVAHVTAPFAPMDVMAAGDAHEPVNSACLPVTVVDSVPTAADTLPAVLEAVAAVVETDATIPLQRGGKGPTPKIMLTPLRVLLSGCWMMLRGHRLT